MQKSRQVKICWIKINDAPNIILGKGCVEATAVDSLFWDWNTMYENRNKILSGKQIFCKISQMMFTLVYLNFLKWKQKYQTTNAKSINTSNNRSLKIIFSQQNIMWNCNCQFDSKVLRPYMSGNCTDLYEVSSYFWGRKCKIICVK